VHVTLHHRCLEHSLHSNQGKGLKFLSLCLAFHEVSYFLPTFYESFEGTVTGRKTSLVCHNIQPCHGSYSFIHFSTASKLQSSGQLVNQFSFYGTSQKASNEVRIIPKAFTKLILYKRVNKTKLRLTTRVRSNHSSEGSIPQNNNHKLFRRWQDARQSKDSRLQI